MQDDPQLQTLLAEQQRYYCEGAPEYLDGALEEDEADRLRDELSAAVGVHCRGDVLELACGPGTWTPMLARVARSVTAVDGASEMLKLAAASVPAGKVRFIEADIFGWVPDRRYDAVFFGFWLSHVPDELWERFWALVSGCLVPEGHVVFVDDGYRAADELVYGEESSVIERRLTNGSRHRIVKAVRSAAELQERLSAQGWSVHVHQVGVFHWGAGRQTSPS